MRRPRKGEVYWVGLDPVRGVEQAGRRPAVVIQNNRGNDSSPYTIIAVVSSAPQQKSYPFIVSIEGGEGGLREGSHVNCAQIRTVDLRRLEGRLGQLSETTMEQVANALRYQLDL